MNIFIGTINGNTANLTSEESWHCFKVLRHKVGDEIHIIDGLGAAYIGVLISASEKQCSANITSGPIYQAKRNYYLHLAIAPTKQIDRIEWMIEKAVEIGVDELTFLKCKNSERVNIKIERIRKIVETAVKQSKQAFIPKTNELVEFNTAVQLEADVKLIAHCANEAKVEVKGLSFLNKKIVAFVGPEGDFTNEEIQLAKNSGFKELSLGDNRLRTETAGLYIVQSFAILT